MSTTHRGRPVVHIGAGLASFPPVESTHYQYLLTPTMHLHHHLWSDGSSRRERFQHLLASDNEYHIKAVTRDPSKPS
jgi:hypothetical protein